MSNFRHRNIIGLLTESANLGYHMTVLMIQMRLSAEAKRILAKLPDERTEQELGYVRSWDECAILK